MTDRQQIAAFEADLNKLVDRYREEFDLTYASAIGVLTMKANRLSQEPSQKDEDEDDE